MEILVASGSGFCMGVKLAIDQALAAAKIHGHIYSIGELIHNPQEMSRLSGQIIAVDDLDQIKKCPATVIIRSHGVSPAVMRQVQEQGFDFIDATCPFVKRAQHSAAALIEQGYTLYILGDEAHPEVVGLQGYAEGKAIIIAKPDDAMDIAPEPKMALIAQTTQKVEDFVSLAAILQAKAGQFVAENTICNHTAQSQAATAALAAQVEAMIVIGGKNSANTKKLAQISKEAGIDVYHIESIADLDLNIVRGYGRIGITAGASTPEHIIEEVVSSMTELEKMENELENSEENTQESAEEASESCSCGCESETTSEPEVTAPAEQVAEDSQPLAEESAANEEPSEPTIDDFAAEYGDMKEIRRGARVKGVVVQVKDDELLVDIGGKSEGVLSASELSTDDAANIKERFNVGDEIEVLILRKENQEGYPVLSKRRVDQDVAWDRLAKLKQERAVVSGTVTDVVKGGVLVDVGLRGFIPASLLSMGYVEDLSSYVGQTLDMKIIECDKHSNKLVLSAKAVLRKAASENKEKTWEEIAEGQTRQGVVRRIASFGVFVDVGGVDGLLHVSEMAWYRVNHPADLLKEGDQIEVFVLGVDRENEKISLGLKQLIPNPWSLVVEKYPEGTIITAKVMRTTTFGAFLEVEPGVEGLVHISQLANYRVDKTEDIVKPGDMVEVEVLSVDPEAKRMSLSIKATLPEDAPTEPPTKEVEPEAVAEELAVEEAAPAEEGVAAEEIAEESVEETAATEETAESDDAAEAEKED